MRIPEYSGKNYLCLLLFLLPMEIIRKITRISREALGLPFPRKERKKIFIEMCSRMQSKPLIQLVEKPFSLGARTAGFYQGYMSDSDYRLFKYKTNREDDQSIVIRGEMAEKPNLGFSDRPQNIIASWIGVNLANSELKWLYEVAKVNNTGIGGFAVQDRMGNFMEFYLLGGSTSEEDYLVSVDNFYDALSQINEEIGQRKLSKDDKKYAGLQMPVFHH